MRSKDKVSVITLGCSKNTVDSERLLNQLKANEFRIKNNPRSADTVIINTCGFIEAAKQESIDTILNATELKKKGKIKKVIVAGCLSERYKDDLEKEIPEVDAYFGTEKYEDIVNTLGGEFKYELLGERVLTAPSHSAYLKISEGCDNPCSFCAIPLMRGLHKSVPMEMLLREASFLAGEGTKELIIIGQDTTDYGKDLYGKRNLAVLLNKLSQINGIEWIRLMYAYPSHFPLDIMEEINSNSKIVKYIDMPLQHISEDCLKSMRRGISKRRTIELIDTLRNKIDNLVLRTTFIVGYTAEKQKDFDELYEFVSRTRFDRMGVFTYSVEEKTPAFILGDSIDENEKERRKEVLMELQKDISNSINARLVGTELNVLIDRYENGVYFGRSYRDAPEVDGEVIINNGSDLSIGEFYTVKITDHNEYDLYGSVVPGKQ
ncbi:MAG: 30S ribosomal protein S12 methylthiotransferase RimO [Ignavibacteriaceae bacterium]|nr:30S ribosomal protein S12 methylthiotransferase RimO [Ignavibacteriaceae bacterium]